MIISIIQCNNVNASVTCIFYSDLKTFVECDGSKKTFNSIEELSNNINDLTKQYFTIRNSKIDSYDDNINLRRFLPH